MTEEQYWKLCHACDLLLLQPGASKARIATGWLHILREHPLLLARYEALFSSEALDILRWRASLLLRRVRYLASYFKSRYRAGQANGAPYSFSASVNGRPDIVFVSHLLNPRLAGASDDFYFGSLPASLAADGVRVAVVLINHTSEDAEKLAGSWKSNGVPRIVLANSLDSPSEIEIQRQLREESRRIAVDRVGDTDELRVRVRQQASVEALSGMTRTALRQSMQFEQLMGRLEPRVLLTTHEGHPWERLAYASARATAGEIHCVGYIQGTLSRLQHALQRNLADAFNPDRVLTAGVAAKHQLKAAGAACRIPVEELGSNRWIKPVGAQLRSVAEVSGRPGCLVIPEGITEECLCLFLFSLECALAIPSVNFIWRLHPLITFDMLRKLDGRFSLLPGNITMSNDSIDSDISRSQWALYRGSTAIVQCGTAGLRPVYLNLPDELPFDALYELQEWRQNVSTADEFCRVVKRDLDADEAALKNEAENAKNYIGTIYTALKPEALKSILASHIVPNQLNDPRKMK